MNPKTKQGLARHVIAYEVLGFGLVTLFLWLDEILDLPHYCFGAPATPINWRESCFESLLTIGLASMVIFLTHQFLTRIKYLEGFLLFCAGCKKVRLKGEWIPVDVYVRDHSDASISHGLCPDCLTMYCGDWKVPDSRLYSKGEA
jgi:hypothetical protein